MARSFVMGLGLGLGLISDAAFGAHSVNGLVLDKAGRVIMLVEPDNDSELDDPAFHPAGSVMVKVPVGVWKATQLDQLGLEYTVGKMLLGNGLMKGLAVEVDEKLREEVERGDLVKVEEAEAAVEAALAVGAEDQVVP